MIVTLFKYLKAYSTSKITLAAAICGVDAFELARRNMKPVVIGLIVTTIVGVFLI